MVPDKVKGLKRDPRDFAVEVGIEPTTKCLTGTCSTAELHHNIQIFSTLPLKSQEVYRIILTMRTPSRRRSTSHRESGGTLSTSRIV